MWVSLRGVLSSSRIPLYAAVVDWLWESRRRNRMAYAKCVARVRVLSEIGHELRRPMADYLRDGIFELRVREGHVNYRLRYFFHGKGVADLVHALTKEKEVGDVDIERAIQRKEAFHRNPRRHTYGLGFEEA